MLFKWANRAKIELLVNVDMVYVVKIVDNT